MERGLYEWLQVGLTVIVGVIPYIIIVKLDWQGWWASCLAVVAGALFAFLTGWAMEVRKHDKESEKASAG